MKSYVQFYENPTQTVVDDKRLQAAGQTYGMISTTGFPFYFIKIVRYNNSAEHISI
jgi:hypothetical protein